MSGDTTRRELRGLARSIGSLFQEGGPAGTHPSGGTPPDRARALAHAVTAFIAASPRPEPRLSAAVRAEAAARVDAGELDAVADAVRRLALHGGAMADPACLGLARELATEDVCDIVVRGGTEGKEAGLRDGFLDVSHRLGPPMAAALGRALSGNPERAARRACLDALVALGEVAGPVVEEMMEDARWYVVRNGVAVLGETGGARAVESILSALAHADARVRKEAVRALAKLGGEDAAQLVYGMLDDPDAEVRLAAAMAAGALRIERALRPLLNLLDEESDEDVVIGVLKALGQLGDPGAVNAVERRAVTSFLSRPPAHVRIAAYRALYAIGTPHAKSLLVRAADDKDPEVKDVVRKLLRMR